jgi:hypothetical protein
MMFVQKDLVPLVVQQLVVVNVRRPHKKQKPTEQACSALTALCNLMMCNKSLRGEVRKQVRTLFLACRDFHVNGCPVLGVPPIRADVLTSLVPSGWNKQWRPYPQALVRNIILRVPTVGQGIATDVLTGHYNARRQSEPMLQVLGTNTLFNEEQALPACAQKEIIRFFVTWVLIQQAKVCANCRACFSTSLLLQSNTFKYGAAVCTTCASLEWVPAKTLWNEHGVAVSTLKNFVLIKHRQGEAFLWRPHLQRFERTVNMCSFRKRSMSFISACIKASFARRRFQQLRAKADAFEAAGHLLISEARAVPAISHVQLPPWRVDSKLMEYIPSTKVLPRKVPATYWGSFLRGVCGPTLILSGIRCSAVYHQMSSAFAQHTVRANGEAVITPFLNGCVLTDFNRPLALKHIIATIQQA